MDKKNKRLQHQIIKFNTKDSLMEVNAGCFELGKVQFHIHKYDIGKEKGNRILQEADVFVTLSTALALCHDILTGRINRLITEAKKQGKKYEAVWSDMGGVSAKKLAIREEANLKNGMKLESLKAHQKRRADGKSLARVFKIVPSSRDSYTFALQFELGAGEENETGLIVPKYGTNPDVRLIMAFTPQQAKELALMIKLNIESFITQKYVRMEDEDYYK